MITSRQGSFILSQLNFTNVPVAYTVDKTADEVCMRKKSSKQLDAQNHISIKRDKYLLL